MLGGVMLTVALVLTNGFFVAAELALVKVRTSQLDLQIAAGHRTATLAKSLVQNIDRYLSATQLGVTAASLALGWVGEPAMAALLLPLFAPLHLGDEIVHQVAFGLGFTLISFLHIVVGEVAPKGFAIARPASTAMAVAMPLRAFYIVSYPALMVLNRSSNLLLRFVGIQPGDYHGGPVAAEELKRIAEDSAAEGQITKGEGYLLSNVFTFSDRVAREIMVPRNKVIGLDLRQPVADQIRFALESGHTRYPVFDGDLDQVVGMLQIKDLLIHQAADRPIPDLRPLCRPPLFVPESMSAQRLLRTFQRQHTHIAVVLDEYGGVAGITTLEDALEELVGEIQDEYDEERAPVEETLAGYSVAGGMLLSDVCELIGVAPIESESSSVAGYLMDRLERVPRLGDEVDLAGWMVRVTQLERRTVERVELVRPPLDRKTPSGKPVAG